MFNFITQASDSIINFGIGILLARYLGSADYGLYSFLIWFLYFLALFANLGLGQMVIRYIAEAVGRQNREDLKNVISLALWLRIGIVILVMLIVIIFSNNWANIFGHPGSADLFIILAIGFAPHMLNRWLTGPTVSSELLTRLTSVLPYAAAFSQHMSNTLRLTLFST